LLVAEPGHLLHAEGLDEIAAELPRGPDHDDPGQKTLPMRRSVSSISWSRVIQPML
jgi:hypothetical protein